MKKVGTNRCELKISVGSEEFEKGIDLAYKKSAKRYTVPGFRKGKAPRSFIERRYGKGIFYEDAVNILCPKALDDAIKSSGIEMVEDKIDFDLKHIDENGFTFTAVLTTKPEIEISGYKGIKIKPFEGKVTEEKIDERINEILKSEAKLVEVTDRACKKSDTVTLDFEGKIHGKTFSGGSGSNYSLKLGSHSMLDGFEEGIIGHKTGDVFDVAVRFPEWIQDNKLKGKEAIFTITLHEIKEPKLPELTDDFVKEVSKKNTVEEFKVEIKEKLEKELVEEEEEDKNMQIINAVVNLVKSEVPEAMYAYREKENMNIATKDLIAKRATLEDILDFTKAPSEGGKSKCRELAEQQVKLALALESIVKQENIIPSKEEIEEKYKEISGISGVDVDTMKKRIEEKVMIHDISCLKAFELLKEKAVVEGSGSKVG